MPRNKDWFAYKANEPETCAVIAEALGKKLGLPFETEDIAVTNGAFAALVVAIHLLADPGDEVVFSIPPWFCYEALIINAGAVPIKVPVIVSAFDLDLDAIAGAITPRTRIVIVNSAAGRWQSTSRTRSASGTRHRAVAAGRDTWGHSISEFEALSIDVGRLQHRRDRIVEALADIGYEVGKPEGTFYVLPRAPVADDIAFARSLADRDVFVVPGSICELPGYFRISLTATEEMIERSLPIFAEAFADHVAFARGAYS